MEFLDYPNVPAVIGRVISAGLASLVDIDQHLGLEDLYDLLEIAQVDAINRRAQDDADGN